MTLEQQRNDRAAESASVGRIHVLHVDECAPPVTLSDADDVALSSVETAADARQRLSDDSCGVDCVVSEYELPESDGLELLGAVRDDHPNLPFVVFTDSGSEAVASEAIGMGATDYLPKDVGGEQLRERIGRAVAATSIEADSGVSGDQMRQLTSAFPDVAFIIDETGRYLEVMSGPSTGNLRTVQQEGLVGKHLYDAFDDPKADRLLDHVRTTLETGGVETIQYQVTTDVGERWFEGRTAPLGTPIDGREAVIWVARDVTERRENERELADNRDELSRLNRINDLINSIFESLVASATREEIERTVCDELANSEFYQFAWIGGAWVKDGRMNPSVVVGVEREQIEPLIEATSSRSPEQNSFMRVVTEGDSVVVTDVSDTEILSERESELMLELGMSSAVLVPLTYGDTHYGILGISGACRGTFSERELSALETLGKIVAFAINAVKNRNLIFSDTAVELEFRVESRKSGFGKLSTELGCRFWLEGVVPVSEDRLLEYIAVEGASASTIIEELEAMGALEGSRIVTEDDDECLFEMELAWSGVDQLVKTGTVVKSAVAEEGVVRFVAEASSDVDVRSVVDSFRTAYPDAELVSKQEINRPVQTTQEFRQTLTEELTDKQQTALQTAYFAGYYEFPRESTGEDVAESLGISSPTLHQHLRAAQRKLVGTFLDL